MGLPLHTQVGVGAGSDCVKLTNRVLSQAFLPMPEETAFPACFGHLAGYDAGYYGYAWAEAVSADLASVLEPSPKGCFDAKAGRRLREEIHVPGAERVDVVGPGPGEVGDVNVGDARELALGLADGPAHDFDAVKPFAGGEFEDLAEVQFREDGGDESELHGGLWLVARG
jgi:hypothetical protein